MDDYGIKASALTGLRVYEAASIRSGRTLRMIQALQPDCLVLCANSQEARLVERVIKERRPDLVGLVRVEASSDVYGAMRDQRRRPGGWFATEQFVLRHFETAIAQAGAEMAQFFEVKFAETGPGEPPPVWDRG